MHTRMEREDHETSGDPPANPLMLKNQYSCFFFSRKFLSRAAKPPAEVAVAFCAYADVLDGDGRGDHRRRRQVAEEPERLVMSAAQLLRFMREAQGESDATLEDAERIVEQLRRRRHHLPWLSGSVIELEDFFQYLFSDELNPPIRSKVHQDMTVPLSQYYIYTGHNSYLTGNQFSSKSSGAPIIKALLRGVRVIELDMWPNAKKNNINILHGWTLTRPVKMIKCLKSIKEHAFVASPYPVVITLEDHLTPDLQAKAAEMITQTFGDMLYYPETENLKEFPSPEDLKMKIIISTRPPKECLESNNISKKQVSRLEFNSFQEGEIEKAKISIESNEKNTDKNKAQDQDEQTHVQQNPRPEYINILQKENAEQAQEDESSQDEKEGFQKILSEFNEKNTDKHKAQDQDEQAHVRQNPRPEYINILQKANEQNAQDQDDKSSQDEMEGFHKISSEFNEKNTDKNKAQDQDEQAHVQQNPQPEYISILQKANAEDAQIQDDESSQDKTKRFQKISSEFNEKNTDKHKAQDQDEQVHVPQNHRPEYINILQKANEQNAQDQDDESSQDEMKGFLQNSSPSYKQLITVPLGKKGKMREVLMVDHERVMRMSLSEKKLAKAVALHGTDLVRFTQRNILRVYPKGIRRINSSNYDPLLGWMHGAQMVAFNMQSNGKSLWLMHGLFRANGGCGYVKKPDFLLKSSPQGEVFDPKASLPVKKILKVKVYMGDGWHIDFSKTYFDIFSPPDFYVRVGIAGMPADTKMKKTRTIADNWVPVWNEEFSFSLTAPELALLRIEVFDQNISEKDDMGGQTCLPVWELMPGTRAVSLYNKSGDKLKSVRLLIHFNFE